MDRIKKIKQFAKDHYFELGLLTIAATGVAVVNNTYKNAVEAEDERRTTLFNARLDITDVVLNRLLDNPTDNIH
jgi:hypothetical protein